MRVNRLRMGQNKIQNVSFTEGAPHGIMGMFGYDLCKGGYT